MNWIMFLFQNRRDIEIMKNSRKNILIFASLLIWQILPLKGQSFSDRQIHLKPVHYKLDIKIDYENEQLIGKCQLAITNPTAGPVQKVPLILYRLMKVTSITDASGKTLAFKQQVFSYDDFEALQVNFIEVSLQKPLAKDEQQTIQIDYEGKLLGYAETGMRYIQDRIDPQFTIIRPDCRAYPAIGVPCWKTNRKAGLPEFDYEINVTVPDTLVAVNFGILIDKKVESGQATYSYKNARPSWRIDIPIARYGILESDKERIFYLQQDSLRAGTIMEAMKKTGQLYAGWFGALHSETGITLIEISDGFGSQTTAGCIIQSAGAFKDDQRLYELYHEISHLWNAPSNDPYPPRWEEGLAMFLQYLTVEKLEHRRAMAEASQRMIRRLQKSFAQKPQHQNIPMMDYGKEDVTDFSYTAGMLFFHTLYSLLGEQEFLAIVGSFYQKYYANGATTEEFINHVKSKSGVDLTKLFNEWFYESTYSEYLIDGLSMDQIVRKYK